MDIDSPAQTETRTGKVSYPLSESLVDLTTNTNTPIPAFNSLVIDPVEEVLNTSYNIIDDEEPKCNRPAISGLSAAYSILLSRHK
jgi:hypothetical protein